MHQRDAFMLKSMNNRLHSETDKVLCEDFVRRYMNDVTIPLALCIEKNIIFTFANVFPYMTLTTKLTFNFA